MKHWAKAWPRVKRQSDDGKKGRLVQWLNGSAYSGSFDWSKSGIQVLKMLDDKKSCKSFYLAMPWKKVSAKRWGGKGRQGRSLENLCRTPMFLTKPSAGFELTTHKKTPEQRRQIKWNRVRPQLHTLHCVKNIMVIYLNGSDFSRQFLIVYFYRQILTPHYSAH
jgi:hypothetical protein